MLPLKWVQKGDGLYCARIHYYSGGIPIYIEFQKVLLNSICASLPASFYSASVTKDLPPPTQKCLKTPPRFFIPSSSLSFSEIGIFRLICHLTDELDLEWRASDWSNSDFRHMKYVSSNPGDMINEMNWILLHLFLPVFDGTHHPL